MTETPSEPSANPTEDPEVDSGAGAESPPVEPSVTNPDADGVEDD